MIAPRLNKIAAITACFWVAKVIATTLGETGGDFLAQTLGLGYVAGFAITVVLLAGVLIAEIQRRTYSAPLFWAAVVATTTAGTEISDMMDRTFGLGYVVGSALLLSGLLATLAGWYWSKRTLRVDPVLDRGTELYFWIAVVFSNSLGTAFGDALVDNAGLSFVGGALVCATVIGGVLILHYLTRINATVLFWVAFVFTRPFGATFGNFLTKEHARGGLELGTAQTTLVALVLLAGVVALAERSTRGAREEAATR